MKGATCASLMVLGVFALSIAAVTVDAQGTKCGNKNCTATECCISTAGLLPRCQKLRKEGEGCETPGLLGAVLSSCPCETNLKCVVRGNYFVTSCEANLKCVNEGIDLGRGNCEKVTPAPAPAPATCRSNKDCATNECCTSLAGCQKVPKYREVCSEDESQGPSSSCPCEGDLTCISSMIFFGSRCFYQPNPRPSTPASAP